ncbi:unnamed protein product [Blepharisma stoltei]|uniref:RRM domain-containing protein n=1 Tax=Blepharisma stoltei TaxID=1481888 RepID=A0AAU9I7G9_9CILI|nr:unnamed protein product [Blepharisma stoltei]
MEAKTKNWADHNSDSDHSDHEAPAAAEAKKSYPPREPRPRQDLNEYIQSKQPPYYFKLINIPYACDQAADIQSFFAITDEELSEKKASIKMINFEGRFKGVAYVNAWDIEVATKIIAKNENELKGRKIGILVETKGPSEGRGNRGNREHRGYDRKPREGGWREENKEGEVQHRPRGHRGARRPYGDRNRERAHFRNQEPQQEPVQETKKTEANDDVWGEAGETEVKTQVAPAETKKEEPRQVKERTYRTKAWGDSGEATEVLSKPSQAPQEQPKYYGRPYERRGRFRGRRPNRDRD